MNLIFGAGPTGLALAWLLKTAGEDVRLYEASGQAGGHVRSAWRDGHLLEFGPNSLRMTDALHAFLSELGMADQIVPAHKAARRRYLLKSSQYEALPTGPLSFLLGCFFPWSAKRRIFAERNLVAPEAAHESADAFIRRRFGDFAADTLLAAFVSGIYAGDSRRLIAALAFPQLVEHVRQHGSVIRGMFKAPKQQHKGIFSFPDGLQAMTDRLATDLGPQLTLDMPLRMLVQRPGQGWEVHAGGRMMEAQQVVLCMPAHAIAPLMESLDPDLAERLRRIHYPPVALVHRVYRREQVQHALDGFGALHVPTAQAFSLGTIFSSTVFPQRSPQGTVLLTTMVGGAVHPERALLPDSEILGLVHQDHRHLLGVQGTPLWEQVTLYRQAIPQYDAAAIGLQAALDRWAGHGLHFAGNFTRGISVPDCIQNAIRLCEQLKASRA